MEINTKYKHVVFKLVTNKPKTSAWECYNKNDMDDEIGEVKWYFQWRQYCYFPAPFCVFSRGCLKDIANFIEQLMNQRKTA